MNYLYYVFGALIFIAVMLFLTGLYQSWNTARGPESERVARRLRMMSAGAHSGEQNTTMIKQRLLSDTPALQRMLLEVPRVHALDRLLEQSGLAWSVAQWLMLVLLTFLVALLASSFFDMPWWLHLLVAALCTTLPLYYIERARTRRLERIGMQLPDALDLMSRALRAGHAFPTSLKMVGDEMNAPLADEFRIAFDEVNFGIAMQDALMNLATRVPSTDVRYFVIAVLIQRETGGNLSELLDSIARIIRERMKLLGQVRVLSAEARLSAWILSLLPFAAAAVIQLTNPTFLDLLYHDPSGQKMLAGALVLMLIGIGIMRKIIHIHV
ncbi:MULTISPECIES: type II secretion system F family protein [unclassified Janthinobacterium]|uniref:type II secretion system F family protein n=1 Tax=unclassified Janthinobacterium TaxID=2610881 RepID=UPI001609BAAA|nr:MULTISPECIES: type II secretion system F family protein [unclassified Janthinobacterium]MBB5608643.1 tight adherence protein B [Janthinobacterium sp. S3T4]MBB5613954.1 tight adherence protein B [Janthinobacterium sp. S3M3]